MGSEAEPEPSSTPQLPLFSIPPMQSPEPSGMLTPPLHATASVPFRWEDEPGRPRPYTSLSKPNSAASATATATATASARCLELPPRLFTDANITKMASPTTVLEGPYVGKSIFQSSSFRFKRERHGSFRGTSPETQRGHVGAMVLLSKGGHNKEKGFFGSWGRRTLNLKGRKRNVDGGGSFVYSTSSVDGDGDGDGDGEADGPGPGGGESQSGGTAVKMTKIRRSGSFLSVSHSRSPFWETICEGFKQVIPWKGRKLKKDGVVI